MNKEQRAKIKEVKEVLQRKKDPLLFKLTERYTFGWLDPRVLFKNCIINHE